MQQRACCRVASEKKSAAVTISMPWGAPPPARPTLSWKAAAAARRHITWCMCPLLHMFHPMWQKAAATVRWHDVPSCKASLLCLVHTYHMRQGLGHQHPNSQHVAGRQTLW